MRCSVEGCRWSVQESDLCSAHLRRSKAFGSPIADSLSDWDRFMTHVEFVGDCWLWTGARNPQGYGVSSWGLAHRYAYRQLVGPIAADRELDHLCHTVDQACLAGKSCRHRRCVNPSHLEPVTQRTNAARSRAGEMNGARLKAQTHCKRGHSLSGPNVRIKKTGARVCRSCERIRKGRSVLAGHEEGA